MTLVRVSDLRPGDVITLPRGSHVIVERLDSYSATHVLVRWWRHQKRYPRDGVEIASGRYLGTLKPLRPDELVDRYRQDPDPEPA